MGFTHFTNVCDVSYLTHLQMTEEYLTWPSDTNKWMKTIALRFCNISMAVKNRAHSIVFIGLR